MAFRVARALVALALVVSIQATGWAACGAQMAPAAAKRMCHTPAEGHCPMATTAGELPDCCKVKPQNTSQPIMLAPPASARDWHQLAALGAVVVLDAIPIPASQQAFARAARAPLKPPGDPTYLRNSVLLI